MNAMLPRTVTPTMGEPVGHLPPPSTVSLDDKYSLSEGRAFMSGVQALVRLPMLQHQRDALQGKKTAGFISGYRGSPLGGYDQALQKASKYLKAHHVVFQPGVNEELAATAVWGTQQLGFAPAGTQKYDGVFGIWYGKGPGVDRCSDVFKHANMAGTTPWGGALAIAGDDHVAKSSTAAHQSDHIFKACGLPVFFPTSVQDILDLGLHALALSRFAGVWAGMKTIQEIVESSATALIDPTRVQVVVPDFPMPPGGVHIRWPDAALDQEARLFDHKWYAALAYVRANRLNHNVIEGPADRLGIMASGKAYNDTRQALQDLGLDDATCRRVGLRLHKVAVVWPLEAQTTREFATGLKEILVVEEKRQVIEYQLKEELYNWRSDVRPNVLGKFNELDGDFSGGEWSMPNPSGNTLLRANADLSPALIARTIAQRLKKLGVPVDVSNRMDQHLARLDAKDRQMQTLSAGSDAVRQPWFCSGCPHNTSTKVPDGSRAMAGIGCHFMSIWMDRATVGFTQMGGEGVPWVGQQPFSTEQHVFANLGDGTYFHSGILAIRQSIAAGVNITYKILYNDAVAMTGGQQVGERPEGHSVVQIANSMQAEGVTALTIVTDEPEKYDAVAGLPAGLKVHHRDELDSIQRQFREIKGTTVIIYDQTCATEKRRRRKRGTLAQATKTVVINDLVCEGCGDCGVQSNCLSIEPLETELGRKRTINQSSCNKDLSCIKGFCPSFVTVEGQLKGTRSATQSKPAMPPDPAADLPEPEQQPLEQACGIVVAGVGGTGVITVGQLLGMAAHLEGKGIVTQDAAGLAQKGGATWSHVLIAPTQADICTTRVGMASADVVLGCDPIVTASKDTLQRMQQGRTRVALNSSSTPTAAFVKNGGWENPSRACLETVAASVASTDLGVFDAEHMAKTLMGDTLYINPMLLGFAWQKGWIPLQRASLLQAMALNGVSVEANQRAFAWGRAAAHNWAEVQKKLTPTQAITLHRKEGLDSKVAKRVEFLTSYQNAEYAQQYRQWVERTRAAEAPLGKTTLTEAVATQLFRLMAYKDEYEVARLHTHPEFLQKLDDLFEPGYRLGYHLAPPLLAKTDSRGELIKRPYGSYMHTVFRWLAPLKAWRGTAIDLFGHTEERRTERQLIADYQTLVATLLKGLTADTHAQALELARIPDGIKGFGHVKARNLKAVRQRWQSMLESWSNP
jgi:indolepyruvate ferredoxin oxidoreductase